MADRENFKFWLDIEATDIGLSNRDKVIRRGQILQSPIRGSIPQMLQFHGQLGMEGDAHARPALSEHIHMDLPEGVKPQDIDIQFETTEGKTLNNQRINEIMGKDTSQRSQYEKKLYSEMRGRKGKFSTPAGLEVLNKLVATKVHNPTPGMWGIGATISGSTLNMGLASNVFESKFSHGDMKTSQKFISKFLTEVSSSRRAASRAGVDLELVGHNIGYDVRVMGQNVDQYGTDMQKKLYKGLLNHQGVKIVDTADKIKDVQFALMLRDESYTLRHLDQKEVSRSLKEGHSKENIHGQIKRELTTNRINPQSRYITEQTGLRKLADTVRTQTGAASSGALEASFISKLRGPQFNDVTSDEKKIVKHVANMVQELANPGEERSSTEIMRRHINEFRHLDQQGKTTNKLFNSAGGSAAGIMGFDNAKDIRSTPEGSLTRGIMGWLNSRSTALDISSGYSQSAGDGLLGSFIQSKSTYIETIGGESKLKAPIRELFASIDSIDTTGAAHDASIDVKRMGDINTKILNRHLSNPRGADTQIIEYMKHVQSSSQIDSAWESLGRYLDGDSIDRSLLSGYREPYGHQQQTIAAAGDSPAVSGATVGEMARSDLNPVQRALKTKGGALAKGALLVSGMLLLANRNGDIKSPGSRHNVVTGVSPSGDPLLHSFGSGNDPYSNQALSNLHYRFNMGSDTLRSSMLGYRGRRLQDMLLGRSSFDDYTNSSEKGNVAHGMIEAEYMKKGLAQAHEHIVYSADLDVMGHIDIVLNSGVPLEIKTVEDFEALQKLNRPKPHHVSQANFYAYALKQPYALIGYAARNDPTKVKYFKVNTNIKKVMEDARAVRSSMTDLKRQGHDVTNYSAYQYMKDAYGTTVQNKYQQNAAGPGANIPDGMLMSPEDYGGYSAIKSLGDYSSYQKASFKQEARAIRESPRNKSKVRSQAKNADLHANVNLKKKTKLAYYHNRSRKLNYSNATV
jgi:hypothetical protein